MGRTISWSYHESFRDLVALGFRRSGQAIPERSDCRSEWNRISDRGNQSSDLRERLYLSDGSGTHVMLFKTLKEFSKWCVEKVIAFSSRSIRATGGIESTESAENPIGQIAKDAAMLVALATQRAFV